MGKQAPARDESAPTSAPMSRERRRVLYGALGACVLGVFMIHQSLGNATVLPSRPPAAHSAVAASSAALPLPHAARTVPAIVTPDAHPIRLSIPTLGVNAPFTPLDVDAAGVLSAPAADDTNLVGWYKGGTVPGNRGPALVLGHVDTKTAPAVFWGLSTLTAGSTVDIARDDGVTATFTVDSAEVFAKDAFPDDRVYGKTKDAQLRLITCGGSYDRKKKDYTANVVVFAHLTGLRET